MLPCLDGMNRMAIDTSDYKASFELVRGDLFEIDHFILRDPDGAVYKRISEAGPGFDHHRGAAL